jgi:putative Holliday junction resolvase
MCILSRFLYNNNFINFALSYSKQQLGRILAIDYGKKRVGLAVTDEMKIIANSIGTLHSQEVINFLIKYVSKENVECFVVGEPKQMDYSESESVKYIEPFIKQLKKVFPDIPVKRFDERFTSKMALQTMIDAGLKKKDRQNKALVDSISATIILQSYMESLNNNIYKGKE